MIFVFMSVTAFGQIKVVQFNAEWNKTNQVPWVMELKDCKTISFIDIGKNADDAKKHKIAVPRKKAVKSLICVFLPSPSK